MDRVGIYRSCSFALSLFPCKAQYLTQSHALLCSLSLLIRISRSNALSDCCLRAGYDMHSPFLRIWGSTVYGTQFCHLSTLCRPAPATRLPFLFLSPPPFATLSEEHATRRNPFRHQIIKIPPRFNGTGLMNATYVARPC